MFELIPKNTATAIYRRCYFTLVDATDFVTPEDIVVTGVKVSLSFNGAAAANSTNDIVKVNGAAGEYYIELTQAESNTALGQVRGWLTPTGCAITKIQASVVTDDLYAAAATSNEIADALLKRDLSAVTGEAGRSLMNFIRSALPLNRIDIAAGVATVYKEDDTTIAFTINLTGTPAITGTDRA